MERSFTLLECSRTITIGRGSIYRTASLSDSSSHIVVPHQIIGYVASFQELCGLEAGAATESFTRHLGFIFSGPTQIGFVISVARNISCALHSGNWLRLGRVIFQLYNISSVCNFNQVLRGHRGGRCVVRQYPGGDKTPPDLHGRGKEGFPDYKGKTCV